MFTEVSQQGPQDSTLTEQFKGFYAGSSDGKGPAASSGHRDTVTNAADEIDSFAKHNCLVIIEGNL